MRQSEKAKRLFRGFRETEPTRAKRVAFKVPRSLTVMGRVTFIGYTTTIGREARAYKHDFAAGSRPLLCADPESGKVFLIGGRYRVTSRGIVDLDAKRRELE